MNGMLVRWLCLVVVTSVCVCAARFQLEVEKLTPEQAVSTPGGYGGFGQFTLEKPASIQKTPALTSQHPLYGVIYSSRGTSELKNMVFLLDEPAGTGRGYSRLFVDVNGNGSFGEGEMFEKRPDAATQMPGGYEQTKFGPVMLPKEKAIGVWQPSFYVEVFLYNKEAIGSSDAMNQMPIGQLRILTGSQLVTTVDIDGISQKFGLIDGNCNFHIPDGAESMNVRRSAQGPETWMLSAGDWILRDRNGDGAFGRGSVTSDGEMFSSITYFGAKPYHLEVSPDLSWIELEPYTGAMGRLKARPEVQTLVMGWAAEGSTDYQAVQPVFSEGQALVPAGDYRVSSCVIGAKTAGGSLIMAASTGVPDQLHGVKADQDTALDFGLPLTITTTAEIGQDVGGVEAGGFVAAVGRMFGRGGAGRPAKTLVINAAVTGAGGESYSGFMEQPGTGGYVPAPKFEVIGPDGAMVASGSLEYG